MGPAAIGPPQWTHLPYQQLLDQGDGAFQMGGTELATAARFGLNPIVVVLNNHGYSTEPPMIDGTFNDVASWNFSRLPEIFGAGTGFAVHTEIELASTLKMSQTLTDRFCILDVHLDPRDISPALRRLTEAINNRGA